MNRNEEKQSSAPNRRDVASILGMALRGAISPMHETQQRVFDALKTASVAVDRFGELFPASYFELAKKASAKPKASFAQRLTDLVMEIREHRERINAAISAKTEFEIALLNGQWSEARAAIERGMAVAGHSIWSVEAKLALAEHQGQLDGLRRMADELDAQVGELSWMVFWVKQRLHRGTSAGTYQSNVDHILTTDEAVSETLRNYFQFRINFQRLTSIQDPGAILRFERRLALFDQYQSLIRILQSIVGIPSVPFDRNLLFTALNDLRAIRDPRITNLCAVAGLFGVNDFGKQTDVLLDVLDKYTLGNYQAAAAGCVEALSRRPDCFEYYEIHAKAVLNGGLVRVNPLPAESPGFEIYGLIFSVLEKHESTKAALELLEKRSQALDSFAMGPNLFAFTRLQFHEGFIVPPLLMLGLHSSAPSPRMLGHAYQPELTLAVFETRYPANSCVKMFKYVHTNQNMMMNSGLMAQLPAERQLKYQAQFLERLGNIKDASDCYRQLWKISRGRVPIEEEATVGLYRCLMQLGELEECVSHTIDVYFQRKYLLVGIRLLELVRARDAQIRDSEIGAIDCSNIAWPILFHIYYAENGLPKDARHVYTAYDDFLGAHQLSKPSELEDCVSEFKLSRLLFFLVHVCSSDVMHYSLSIDSVESFDAERVALCQLIIKLDPERNVTAQTEEIVRVRAKALLHQAVRDVHERKIYIDIDRLKVLFERTLRERFARCISNLRLFDERVREIYGDTDLYVLTFRDAAFSAFVDLLNEITAYYTLQNDFGLDQCLSTRIRHGVLAGQIRRQFEAKSLVTRLEPSGAYAVNTHWIKVWNPQYGKEFADRAAIALSEFSRGVDGAIDRVKTRWIQIRSDPKDSEAMFDYRFSQEDLAVLYLEYRILAKKSEGDLYEQVIDLIFRRLTKRTEDLLGKVKERIESELYDELNHLLTDLEKKLLEVDVNFRDMQFAQSLTDCRTAIQADLQSVAGWFNLTNRKEFRDFDISLAVKTGLEIMRQLHPTTSLGITAEPSPSFTCAGHTFEPLVYIILILIDNMIRHSSNGSGRIETIMASELVRIEASNPVARTEDLASLRSKLAAMDAQKDSLESTALVRKEGGSGYHKLRKLLRIDLNGVVQENDVRFEVTDGNVFRASVRIRALELQP